jgi:hypothetical protein
MSAAVRIKLMLLAQQEAKKASTDDCASTESHNSEVSSNEEGVPVHNPGRLARFCLRRCSLAHLRT